MLERMVTMKSFSLASVFQSGTVFEIKVLLVNQSDLKLSLWFTFYKYHAFSTN